MGASDSRIVRLSCPQHNELANKANSYQSCTSRAAFTKSLLGDQADQAEDGGSARKPSPKGAHSAPICGDQGVTEAVAISRWASPHYS